MHEMRLDSSILLLFEGKLMLFLVKLYTADIFDCYRCTNDSEHAQRISTSITTGYLRNVTIGKDCCEGFICSTQSRSIRNGTVKRTYHHRQVFRITCIKEYIIADEHNNDIKQYHCCRQDV